MGLDLENALTAGEMIKPSVSSSARRLTWGCCVLDRDGCIVHIDDGFMSLVNISVTPKESVLGHRLASLISLSQQWVEVLAKQEHWGPHGQPLIQDISSALESLEVVPREGGHVLLVSGESGETQCPEVLGAFAAGVSHDVNNAIAAIQGFGEILRTLGEVQEPMAMRCMENIHKGCLQAQDVLNDVRAMGGNFRPVCKPVGLADACHRWVEQWKKSLGDASLSLCQVEFKPEGVIPDILIESERVRTAFFELLNNAWRAVASGGTVSVLCGYTEGKVWLSVADNGTGMAPDVLRRAREPFFSLYGEQGSKGRGLAMACGIMRAHGGSLQLVSRLGQGSCATLCFPVG